MVSQESKVNQGYLVYQEPMVHRDTLARMVHLVKRATLEELDHKDLLVLPAHVA